tara:strand:+ start:11871 stop:12257 length:387 start_codon:yes stop_codon:yes gene_type:complete
MLDFNQINSLGQILNDTWGTTTLGEFRTPTMSIKTSTQGDVMTCQYTTVVNVASERNLRDQLRTFEDESIKKIKDYVGIVKKEFKAATGSALKLKELGTQDNVELITTSPYAPRKTAYYRRFTNFQVG